MLKKLINNATTTVIGGANTLKRTTEKHTVVITITNGISAITVDLDGSIDGITWFTLKSYTFTPEEIVDLKAMFHVVNKPIRQIRGNVFSLTGAGTVNVSYEGDGDDED